MRGCAINACALCGENGILCCDAVEIGVDEEHGEIGMVGAELSVR